MNAAVQTIVPETYIRHPIHGADRIWPETNCYTDLLIEVLHSRGLQPEAALGFTIRQDFEGDQFTFFKVPIDDVEQLFGVTIQELSIYDDLLGHAEQQMARGRMPLVEVDGFFLPDTEGLSYHREHIKTTIGLNRLDREGRRLDYFHGAGLFTVSDADFEGLFPSPQTRAVSGLAPYVEFLKFDHAFRADDLADRAFSLLSHHYAWRPAENPIASFRAALPALVSMLETQPPSFFHPFAFNTVRQFGANFELLATHFDWLAKAGYAHLAPIRIHARHIAESAKSLQFMLARAVARRRYDALDAALVTIAATYEVLIDNLGTALNHPSERRRVAG